jgi:hypothetical protein
MNVSWSDLNNVQQAGDYSFRDGTITVTFAEVAIWRNNAEGSRAPQEVTRTHHTHAARHNGEAAKHHEGGHHEKAAHHAHTARGHALHAKHHSDEASMAHVEEHGKK